MSHPPHSFPAPALPARLAAWLRRESTGGVMLLLATALALVLANSGLGTSYLGMRDAYVGASVGPLDLRMSVGHWASDGLLAVFFFLVGLELKKEILEGDLKDPARAAAPVAAAVGGVVVPALVYAAVVRPSGAQALAGWAVPTATDIAFAVAVLAVVGRGLPAALRLFLLTLAVVDDLLAITIIAVFYTDHVDFRFLAAALVPLLLYAVLAHRWQALFLRRRAAAWLLLLPLGALVWALFVGSGIHATIAGVLLGLCIPVRRGHDAPSRLPAGAQDGLCSALEHRLRPLSAAVCVPVFAFLSAGVAVGGIRGFLEAVGSPVGLGVVLGLVLGKCLGITGAAWLVTRLPGIRLDHRLRWGDVVGVSLLGGVGFTVSLLIAELGLSSTSGLADAAKVGILTGSVLAAVLGGGILRLRGRSRLRAQGSGRYAH